MFVCSGGGGGGLGTQAVIALYSSPCGYMRLKMKVSGRKGIGVHFSLMFLSWKYVLKYKYKAIHVSL